MKKRLVGAAILVSLFVIFTPMLLDPSRLEWPEQESAPIPPPPAQPFPSRLLRLDAPAPDLAPPPEPLAEGVPFEEPAEPLPPPDPGPVLPPAPAPAAAPTPARPAAGPGAKTADKPLTPTPAPTPPAPAEAAPASAPAGGDGEGEGGTEAGDSRVGLSAWAVQLSAYANAANAIALRDALRGRGFVAFVESAPDRTTRVYVGPDLKKGNALAAQQRLARDLGIKGAVVPYPGAGRAGDSAGEPAGGAPRP